MPVNRDRRLAPARSLAALVALIALVRPAAAADVEARVVDGTGAAIDLETSGLALPRTPPSSTEQDRDGFTIVFVGDGAGSDLAITSFSESGARLDALPSVATREGPCPATVPTGRVCRVAGPFRLAIDATDRQHPVARARSIVGELGGAIRVSAQGSELLAVRVVGPRGPGAPIERLRAKLRVFLVRERARGGPPFGATDAIAIALARAQIRRANAVWGQCGVSFGRPEDAEVRVVDPPPPHLLAVGCDLGLPASGGEVRVRAEGHDVAVPTHRGETPRVVAHRLATALARAHVAVTVSHNLAIGPGADGSSDLLVQRKGGGPGVIERASSTDETLRVCRGAVDLSDGLQHFSDVDAVAGTLEERTLLKALDDGDPRTIEVVLVPSFSTGGRIGESFIKGDRSSLPSMVIEDRAGMRADDISFALAHELGHVLLDVPGHSDDFGVDTPTRLMDSDAADPSAFGPRRLDTSECARAVRQSGPRSPTPVLLEWPIASPRRQ